MRHINTKTLKLEELLEEDVPKYVILSHTWGEEEVTFQDMRAPKLHRSKAGYLKIQGTCAKAKEHGILYAWIDTCCIDKRSSAELTEAINSMFAWYQQAVRCYVYLSDVSAS